MTKSNDTAAIVPFEHSYPVLAGDQLQETMLALRENLGGQQVTPFDLDRVTVPAGGATTWNIPSLDDPNGESLREIEGVIIHQRLTRSYWRQSIDESGGGAPPDCYSADNQTGLGTPGGACATCPLAQFGSDDKHRGQACKQMRLLFVLRQGASLPIVIAVPPSSLKELTQFNLRLSGGVTPAPFWAVVTKLSLEKDKNQDGIAYARIKPSLVSRLTPEQRAQVKAYRDAIVPALDAVATATAQAEQAAA